MLLELDHYVWRALCAHCANMSARVCAMFEVADCAGSSGTDCMSQMTKNLLGGEVHSVVPLITPVKSFSRVPA